MFLIIRHRKENLQKCSLRGIEERTDVRMCTYPKCLQDGSLPSFEGCIFLTIDAPILEPSDQGPIVILDATWRYATVMEAQIPGLEKCRKKSIDSSWRTAYPRRQTACVDPDRGLASIEAMYAAAVVTHRPIDGLLDHYVWKDRFLELNKNIENIYEKMV